MLETLLAILSWDAPAAEIILQDGNICLDWRGETGVIIHPDGGLSWAHSLSKTSGHDIKELRKALAGS